MNEQLWKEAALAACRIPVSSVKCPLCGEIGVLAEWSLLSVQPRETSVDLHCLACDARKNVRVVLPEDAVVCHPLERFQLVAEAITKEIESIAERVQRHVQTMPAAVFTTHPLWAEARWSATTYQFHPAGEAPPIMGLVFDNVEAGLDIFREAVRQMGHEDCLEDIRISVIEGEVPGREHRPGYSIHICADPEALCAHATMDDLVVDPGIVPFLGQWNRHYPVPGDPPLLARFKEQFERHEEFLLAPTIRREDGRLYMEPSLGIIKHEILFRRLSDITAPDDTDAAAQWLPQVIVPPT